jgi:hypothetical protein
MSQKAGEVHTAHTFLGVTGGNPGFSLQAKEDAQCFQAAVRDRFTQGMILQVRLLYSDSPNEEYLDVLPNAVGVAEDLAHLPFRMEYCSGGARTACTREVLQLQGKFRASIELAAETLTAMVYHGEAAAGEVCEWAWMAPAEEISGMEWKTYIERAFRIGHMHIDCLFVVSFWRVLRGLWRPTQRTETPSVSYAAPGS